jgi:hypothetical protein
VFEGLREWFSYIYITRRDTKLKVDSHTHSSILYTHNRGTKWVTLFVESLECDGEKRQTYIKFIY